MPVRKKGVNDIPRNSKVIVSLTSYPARVEALHLTIGSLLKQSFKPDAVVLWLAEEQFSQKEKELPKKLLRLCEFGLDICWTKDIRSYKKLIPALKAFPGSLIITADDDVFYPRKWLEMLVKSYSIHPSCVHCHRAHKIRMDETGSFVAPYSKWEYETQNSEPSYSNFGTGVGGVLYPPGSLHEMVSQEALFMDLAPTCDDHWFWAMSVLQGTKIKVVDGGYSSFEKLINHKASTLYSLCDINKGQDFISNDDKTFLRLCQKFPALLSKLKECQKC